VSELSYFTEGMTWQNTNPQCLQTKNDLKGDWCCSLRVFRVTVSKILPKLAKGLYLLIKGYCPVPVASPTGDT